MTEHEELAKWLECSARLAEGPFFSIAFDATRLTRAAALLREARSQPVPVASELLCELFAFAVVCDDKLKGDGLWDEEEDYSEGLFDRVRAEIERQQSAPAAPPSSPHTPPGPAAAPSPAGSTDEAPGSPELSAQETIENLWEQLAWAQRETIFRAARVRAAMRLAGAQAADRPRPALSEAERIQYTGKEEAGDSEGHS